MPCTLSSWVIADNRITDLIEDSLSLSWLVGCYPSPSRSREEGEFRNIVVKIGRVDPTRIYARQCVCYYF
ncbi:MAG: hypothetical protein D6680_15165 [Cyanobacteria bacterium J007]|nr:MAG: hypothetical protein D6680_15165 [Cyanobacteria bacterium J007]